MKKFILFIFFIVKKIKKLVAGKKLGRRFPWILKLFNLLYTLINKQRKSGVVLTNVLDFKMFVDISTPAARPYITDGAIENFETEIFKKEIKEGMVVIDIGANWGYYTLLASSLVKENGKVFAFEPEPHNYEILVQNIKINKCSNVVLFKKACSNKSGYAKLFISSEMASHSLYYAESQKNYIEVELVTLDEIFKGREETIDLIKMDVEGGEMAILEGMRTIFSKNNRIKIFTEFFPERIRASGYMPEDFLNTLIKYGYKIFYIDENKDKLVPVGIIECMQLCESQNGINLFCVKDYFYD